jgi:hypothetical protein
VQPSDEPAAKLRVKNPGGAICRNESNGASFSDSYMLVIVPVFVTEPLLNSTVVVASGLASQLPGSAGRLSRPATVKLLRFPPARAAQRWLRSAVAISGFYESGMILPPAGLMGD